MPLVTLVPMTPSEQRVFIEAQVADYVAWLLVQPNPITSAEAGRRARRDIEAEIAEAAHELDILWSAHSQDALTVGWLWVKRVGVSATGGSAFLHQILVLEAHRRQGFGRAMLAALEEQLASLGYRELRLNVWDSNTAARRLYHAAGYASVANLGAKHQLSKRLGPA